MDGKERRFGPNEDLEKIFWTTGGKVYFDENGNDCVEKAPWEYAECLPEDLRPYKDEIMKIFNDNVPWGCCGGCL